MTGLLDQKTVIVTGGSAGIGAAICDAVVSEGGNVLIHGRREASMAAQATRYGKRGAYVVADLIDPQAPEKIFDAALAAFGSVDGLVNNAAIFPRSNINTDVLDQFDPIFHINARAPLMLAQCLVRHCKARGAPGSIVNIGSINAYCGAPFLLLYSMTKGALMTMTRNLADTLGVDKIRVNQLNVGWAYTDGEIEIQRQAGAPDDWHEKIDESAAPSGKLLQPADVANHAVFWLSQKSAPVSGSVLEVEQFPVIGRNRNSG